MRRSLVLLWLALVLDYTNGLTLDASNAQTNSEIHVSTEPLAQVDLPEICVGCVHWQRRDVNETAEGQNAPNGNNGAPPIFILPSDPLIHYQGRWDNSFTSWWYVFLAFDISLVGPNGSYYL